MKNSVYDINLNYSFYDSSRIGIILGHLNEKGKLIDTLKILGSSNGNLHVSYVVDRNIFNERELSGILFEIKDEKIMAQYPFKQRETAIPPP